LTGNLTVLDTLTSEPLTLQRKGAEWLIVHPNLEQQLYMHRSTTET